MKKRSTRLSMMAFSLSVIGACTVMPLTVDTKATAPVLDGFGDTTLVPSQGNEASRRLFAQGMAQVYAFNPPEAIRAFKAALAQDPGCGMCAWGVAHQMGPTINNPKRGDITQAKRYIDYAVNHSKDASPRDLALIGSLALRYGHSAGKNLAPPAAAGDVCSTSSGEPADPLDIAYAQHMLMLAERFPNDPDVLSAYAEAEMVATRGDDWWDKVTGKPAGRMGELATMIEAGLVKHPEHVGLNHYMIHAVDAVPVAARATAAADRLGRLAPKSPHLLHMPSHTYAHLGRYADATRVNQLANAADEAMMADLKKQKFELTRDWRGHNTHFQWYGALMEGRSELALETARTVAGRSKGDGEFSEYVRALPMLTLLHLQRWDELLKEAMPTGGKGIAVVVGNMARGIALVRTGKLDEAKAALKLMDPVAKKLVAGMTGKDRYPKMIRGVALSSVDQLAAEIAFAEKRIDDALALQAKAVADSVHANGTEPPMLASGPRLRLGSMQMRAGRHAEAEKTYRQDLENHPKNGWALSGLKLALASQGKPGEMQAVSKDLATSWALADVKVQSLQ
ncbi:MAG: hypothetical protein V4633_23125 [Pseudomonadota bacterium]